LGFSIRRPRASFLFSSAESPADDICPIRSHITADELRELLKEEQEELALTEPNLFFILIG